MSTSDKPYHQELARKQNDLYTVYNPTDEDFLVVLNEKINPERWTIHAKSDDIVPMYVAIMYQKKMKRRLLVTESDRLVLEENKKRMDKGLNPMDLHTEQKRFESKNFKIIKQRVKELDSVLIKGLYKEYGITDTKETDVEDRRKTEVRADDSVLSILKGEKPKTLEEKRADNLARARAIKKQKNESN